MKMKVILFILQLLSAAYGFNSGGPSDMCHSMMPHHSYQEPQSTPPPVNVITDKQTYSPGENITVTIQKKPSAPQGFKGFMIRAMSVEGHWFYARGHFSTIPSNAKGQIYYGQNDSCVTHTNNDVKTQVQMTWTAPQQTVGDVVFLVGVVNDRMTFWINVTSAVVSAAVDPNPPLQEFDSWADLLTSEVTDKGCGTNKGCVFVPAKCSLKSCGIFTSWQTNGSRVIIEMVGKDASYLAVGFSPDTLMGDEPFVACIERDNEGMVYLGYNVQHGATNKYSTRHPLPESSQKMIRREDGVLSCRVTLDMPLNVTQPEHPDQHLSFDLINTEHYIMLAQGPSYARGRDLKKHDVAPSVTTEKIALSLAKVIGSSALQKEIKAHAALLVGGWLWLAVCAAMLARHRRVAGNKKTCGKDTWFQLHRAAMFLMFLAVAAGIIIIFVYVKGYTETATLHAPIGLAVTGLAVLQILVALCRPDPGTPRRSFFNWFHRLSALLAFAGAVVTVWLAFDLEMMPTEVSSYGKYSLYAWLAVTGVFEILLEALNCCGRHDSDTVQTSSSQGLTIEEDRKKEGAGQSCSTFVYILFVVSATAPLVAMLYFVLTA